MFQRYLCRQEVGSCCRQIPLILASHKKAWGPYRVRKSRSSGTNPVVAYRSGAYGIAAFSYWSFIFSQWATRLRSCFNTLSKRPAERAAATILSSPACASFRTRTSSGIEGAGAFVSTSTSGSSDVVSVVPCQSRAALVIGRRRLIFWFVHVGIGLRFWCFVWLSFRCCFSFADLLGGLLDFTLRDSSRCFALANSTCAAASSDTLPSVTACTSSSAPSLALLAALLVASRETFNSLAACAADLPSPLGPGSRPSAGVPDFTEIPSAPLLGFSRQLLGDPGGEHCPLLVAEVSAMQVDGQDPGDHRSRSRPLGEGRLDSCAVAAFETVATVDDFAFVHHDGISEAMFFDVVGQLRSKPRSTSLGKWRL